MTPARLPGERLCERLGLTVVGREGHDVKCACVACQSSDAMRVHTVTGVAQCYSCGRSWSPLRLVDAVQGEGPGSWEVLFETGVEQRKNGKGASNPQARKAEVETAPPPSSGSPSTTNGRPKAYTDAEKMAEVAAAKGVSVEALKAFGARPCGDEFRRRVRIPVYGPDGLECSWLLIDIDGSEAERKGKFAYGRPAGLFFPHEGGKVRLPKPRETWVLVEGPKDAAAAHELGCLACGLNTCHLNSKFANLFLDTNVVMLPDLDHPSLNGTRLTGSALWSTTWSTKLALLPGEITKSGGADLRDVLKQEGGRLKALTAIAEAVEWKHDLSFYRRIDPVAGAQTEFELERLTSAELDAGDFQQAYLCEGVLPACQVGVIGGRFKTLKTTISAELVISVGSGTPFLGHFAVPKPKPVIMLSCESGLAAIQDMARRICAAKGLRLAELENVHWSSSLIQLTNEEHLGALTKYVTDVGAELLLIDPTYLVLGEAADSAANVYGMGQFFAKVTALSKETGAAVAMVHHTKKSRGPETEKFSPPELEELAGAGICEWSRFWMLLGRRSEFDPQTGTHRLWLSCGGSAGHSNLVGVDACEGLQTDPGGRRWEVSVSDAEGIRQGKEARREQHQLEVKRQQLEADRQAIVNTLFKFPDGETTRGVRDRAGVKTSRFSAVWTSLIDDGTIVEVGQVKKGNGQQYPRFKLRLENDD